MKRILLSAILICLVLSLSACGSSEGKNNTSGKTDINIVEKPSEEDDDDDYYESNDYNFYNEDYDNYDEHDDEIIYGEQEPTEEPVLNPEDTIYNGEIGSLTMTMLQGYECTCDYTGDYYEDTDGSLVPHGYGEITGTYPYSKGSKTCYFSYLGYFAYGEANGEGQSFETFEDGHTRQYDGSFKNGNFDGDGMITANYYGENPYTMTLELIFTDGHINGEARKTWTYENGDFFEYNGTVKEGYLDGQGVYTKTYASGSIFYYTGEFKEGNRSGNGIQTANYNDGSSYKYEGEFADDKYNGYGSFIKYYTNGDVEQYDGEFKNNEYNGIGTKTLNLANYSEPGDCVQLISDGTFENGKLNGTDCFQYIYYYDGKIGVAQGDYENGAIISGTESLYDSDWNLLNSKVVK